MADVAIKGRETPAAATPARTFFTSGDRRWMALALGVVLCALVLPPLWFLIQGAFTIEEGGISRVTVERFGRIVNQRGFSASAANSFIFAFGSALLALVIGGLVGWLVERTNTPWKPLAYLTTIISMGTPYVLYVSAWLLLLAKAGPINTWWRQTTGSTDVLINVYGQFGMILVEGLLWSPLVFLLLGATLRNFNPELEEASRMSGATAGSTIRRVTLRLSAPSILALAMLVFIRALEAFEVPALVGLPGRVHVLTTDIYDTMHLTMPPDLGAASSLSVLLLALVAVLLYFYGRLTRNAERFATVTGKNFRPNQLDLGKWKYVGAGVLALNFTLLLVLPLIILIWASMLPFYTTFSWAAWARISPDNYKHVFQSSRYISLLSNTFIR